VAVLFGEEGSQPIKELLVGEVCVMSAATRVELDIVIEARTGSPGTQLLDELLARVGMQILPVEGEHANEAIVCWRRFGRGRHPAGLNYGDTFAYALARRLGSPLLFAGDDFAATDVTAA
jgi:ribonuclease VapC